MKHTPPGAQGRYAVAAAKDVANRQLIISKDQLFARANLQRLHLTITRQIRVVELADNLKTSNELIDTLETQRALGFLNRLRKVI